MGFYVRKSLRVGPIRFNLSSSGIGVSTGIRGLRFGTGPRGNYVHMGRHGLYYRATLPSGSSNRSNSTPAMRSPRVPAEPLREIESSDTSEMRDSSSADLLREFDEKRRRIRRAPILAALGAILVVASVMTEAPSWAPLVAAAVALTVASAAHLRDQMSKTVVLFYELEADFERDFQALHDAFDTLRSSMRAWHVEAQGDVRDRKRNAGATSVVRRKAISLSKSSPPFVKTNVEVPSIPVGRQTLYLFPDKLLVFQPSGVGAVPYSGLEVERRAKRFVEDGSLPRDATVVDRTWRYVNKTGGPDRRFKDNTELPIALYEELHLRSRSGLNELLQFSKADIAGPIETALRSLAEHVPQGGV